MSVHLCPWCRCGVDRGPLLIDTSAPFWPLVVELDRIIYAEYIARRTATRRANAGRQVAA